MFRALRSFRKRDFLWLNIVKDASRPTIAVNGVRLHSTTPVEPPKSVKFHLDYKRICERVAEVKENLRHRNVKADVDKVVVLHEEFIAIEKDLNELRRQRRLFSEQYQAAVDKASLNLEVKHIRRVIAAKEARQRTLESELLEHASEIPNESHPDAPVGEENMARLVELFGIEKPKFVFPPKDHTEIGEEHDLFDFEAGSRVSGPRFCFLKRDAALLEQALVQFALSKCTAKGFIPISPPDVAHVGVVDGCGYRPRSEATQVYFLHPKHGQLCMVGTAEIPLGGLYMNEMIAQEQLPILMVAFGHCFRAEAGAPGQASRGLYRLHQFSKVEMFAITEPNQSNSVLHNLVEIQKEIFSDLELHCRLLDMPTAELGASAYRKFDIEACMPGRGAFGEISSASNCTDYQSRRLNIRIKDPQGTHFAHTVNATACAIPRTLLAILETHQQPDGSVRIPAKLRAFMGNREFLCKK